MIRKIYSCLNSRRILDKVSKSVDENKKRFYVCNQLYECRQLFRGGLVPSLNDIINQINSGVQSVNENNLPFNPDADNPIYQKGFDLADVSEIMQNGEMAINDINQLASDLKHGNSVADAEVSSNSTTDNQQVTN